MPKQPQSRKRGASDDYESDGGFVEDAPKNKKSRSSNAAAPSSFQMHKDEEGNEYWDISSKRRVVLSEYKGSPMVSIREYYQDDSGKTRPTKKGMTLPVDQFNAIVELLPQVESVLGSKGIKVPRPQYDHKLEGSTAVNEGEEPGGSDDEDTAKTLAQPTRSKSKLEKFKHRANHEATSDEED